MSEINENETITTIHAQSTQYVAYYVSSKNKPALVRHKTRKNARPTRLSLEEQKSAVDKITTEKSLFIKDSFTEILENNRIQQWPELMKAIQTCQANQATLMIAEIATLTSHDTLTHLLLESGIAFYCVDQPLIDRKSLEALTQYIRLERQKHGQRIRAGLALTSRPSGNPEATALISRVNKPRIYTAILFAQLLMPLIKDYHAKGYSQRQIVKKLNEEGFSAPEGGKWVLSQLQKVLERAKLNEMTVETQPILDELTHKQCSLEEIAQTFNARKIPTFKRPGWKETHIEKLVERSKQILEIQRLNRFILDLLPLLHEYQKQNYSPEKILQELQAAGFPIQAQTMSTTSPTSQPEHNKEQIC